MPPTCVVALAVGYDGGIAERCIEDLLPAAHPVSDALLGGPSGAVVLAAAQHDIDLTCSHIVSAGTVVVYGYEVPVAGGGYGGYAVGLVVEVVIGVGKVLVQVVLIYGDTYGSTEATGREGLLTDAGELDVPPAIDGAYSHAECSAYG